MKGKKPEKDYWFEMCTNNVVDYNDNGDKGWYEEFVTLYCTKNGEMDWVSIREYTLEDLLELKKRFKDHMKLLEDALDAEIKKLKKVKEMGEKYDGKSSEGS